MASWTLRPGVPLLPSGAGRRNEASLCRRDLTFLPDAKRFELGTLNLVNMVGLLASVNLLLEVGIEEIRRWTLHLTDVLIDDLQNRGYRIASCLRPEHRSAIVSFSTPDVQADYDKLIANNVIISLRENYIRVSPHCYNTEEEVLRVGQVLDGRDEG